TEANAANPNATAIKVEGLEVKTTNAYSAANPIPVDQKMQDGVVFRVQIGAFKTALPPNTFKGLSPVNAQTTANGYIRYTAGNFTAFEIANAVKNDLRNLGYSDAFVVGYYDGKRITVSEAVALLEKDGRKVDLASNTSAGISATANIPRNTAVAAAAAGAANTVTDPVVITSELEKMNGLLFTVQIGVYSRQVNKFQLYNLTPIYTEKLPSGLYRYTAGIYNQGPKVTEDQGKVVNIGIKDAFVSSYFNGKRIPFPDGQKIQKDSANVKMEPENPIVFGNNTNTNPNPPAANTTAATPANTGAAATPAVAPFSNGVTSGPAPTAENGVKTDEAGISFKVQIGAYSRQVPQETAAKFLNIKTWPIANKVVNGLYIYTIGNFVDAKSAKKLKDEAVSAGISDAFICVYKDGKKLYGAEATSYLQR
ncbi:MAG: SPOR domain-containing protein, partial [Bacteroidia bacterium]